MVRRCCPVLLLLARGAGVRASAVIDSCFGNKRLSVELGWKARAQGESGQGGTKGGAHGESAEWMAEGGLWLCTGGVEVCTVDFTDARAQLARAGWARGPGSFLAALLSVC